MYIFSAVSAGYLKSLSLCRNSQAVSFGRFFFFKPTQKVTRQKVKAKSQGNRETDNNQCA